nr:MAG: Pentaxin family protein [Bacteriophage sp.]
MGTISDKLMRIINTKEDIRQALISKGYDVPTSIPFKEYAKMISDLPCRVDSFPDIEGIVARYSALGLTNEQMAENPVWKDLTDNGHDLQMKNLAWKGMSGVGGYVGDFSKWVNNRDTTEIGITKSNSKVIIDVKVSQGSGKNIVFISKSNLGISNNVTIKITSTYPEGVMKFANSASNKYLKLPSNGIITLQDNPEYTSNEMHLHLASADLGQITIEQLPLYPGALVFDGVDDYGVCDNFPILTKEKGYTVVALRQWITRGKGALGLVSNVKNWLKDGAFLLEYRNIQADHLNKPISFGAIGSEMDLPHILTYQTSKSYNGVSITTGNFEGTDVLHVGKLAPTNVGTCINAAIWELVFLDHDATEEELTKIKDYFVKTHPWLFPDQAWTTVGKTNEDEDRATIANITGNGNDLVLSNFGFIEGSGYNEEGQHAGYLVTDGVDDMITSSAFQMGKDFTIVGDWKFIDNKKSGTGLVKGSSFYIYNTMIGLDLYINSGSVKNSLDGIKSINAACSDGRAYDRNWNEILANTGNVVGSSGMLEVSSSGGRFDRIAFKNLAIYPRILSKDDCIKAYNYLQTLKSK